jgi:hypothetical protein
MSTKFHEADTAAMDAYKRCCCDGVNHALALNIAVSVWFCRCPHVDTHWARRRLARLLDENA